MVVSSGKTPFHRYFPSDNQAPESLNFEFISAADIVVEDSLGAAKVEGVHYSISGNSRTASASITALVDVPDAVEWMIWSVTPSQQVLDIADSKKIDLALYETELDRVQIIAREGVRDLALAPKVPRGEVAPSFPASADRAGKVARFGEDGGFANLTLEELSVLLGTQVQAARTYSFTESAAPRSEVDINDPAGVGEGGWYAEFSPAANVDFVRAYARVYAGDGSCDVRVISGGAVLWSKAGVDDTATDEAITATLLADNDLIYVVENVVGTITGLVIFLEGAAA